MIRLPTSNQNMLARKTAFKLNNLYPLPQKAWKAASVMKNADPYQPTWSTLLNSTVIVGMAAAITFCTWPDESIFRTDIQLEYISNVPCREPPGTSPNTR